MHFSGSSLRLLPRPARIFDNSLNSKRPQEPDHGPFGTALGKVSVHQKRVIVLAAASELLRDPTARTEFSDHGEWGDATKTWLHVTEDARLPYLGMNREIPVSPGVSVEKLAISRRRNSLDLGRALPIRL